MKLRQQFALSLSILLILFTVVPTPTAAVSEKATKPERVRQVSKVAGAEPPLVIRIGVITSDDYRVTFKRYEDILKNISASRRLPRKVVFRLALGSYSDVLDWYSKDLIDLALLTAAPVVDLRKTLPPAALEDYYIANHASDYSSQPLRFDYQAMCVVEQDSPVKNFADLKDRAQKGKVNFLFVDPLSASGRILPEFLLRKYGIDNYVIDEQAAEPDTARRGGDDQPPLNPVTFKYGATASMNDMRGTPEAKASNALSEEELAEERENQPVKVAFFSARELPAHLRKLPFPELDDIKIPEEVLLINRSFLAHKADIEKLFNVGDARSHFQKLPNWQRNFDAVARWMEETKVEPRAAVNQMVTLDQIGTTVRSYESRYGMPPRLALVLSGGGAKCSYQLGAIQALEGEINKEPNQAIGEKKVDVDLVVGTSGGAINALCVALGLTRDGYGKKFREQKAALEQTWKTFDQKDFFQPWPKARYAFSIGIALLQVLIIIWLFTFVVRASVMVALLRRWFGSGDGSNLEFLYRYMGFCVLALALLNFIFMLSKWKPGDGSHHLKQHLWLLMSLNLHLSVITLAFIGGIMVFMAVKKKMNDKWVKFLHIQILYALFFVGMGVFLFSVIWERTLSGSAGVETALSNKIANLVNPSSPELQAALAMKDGQRLPTITRHVMPHLKRDLVITGSRLPIDEQGEAKASDHTLPDDLYFYYDHQKKCPEQTAADAKTPCNLPSPTDPRFRKFDKFLMDVVIGSSSIYPIFPARALEQFENIARVNIIDGGFAHNSPIEAAVMWKATHVVLIEASPLATPRQSNLLGNTLNAFNHLYYQAQLLDARARGKVEIFTLRPTASTAPGKPDMCTFDFDPRMIDNAIRRGEKDAGSVKPRFRREPGEPTFAEIGVESLAPPTTSAATVRK